MTSSEFQRFLRAVGIDMTPREAATIFYAILHNSHDDVTADSKTTGSSTSSRESESGTTKTTADDEEKEKEQEKEKGKGKERGPGAATATGHRSPDLGVGHRNRPRTSAP